ncbi:MAG: polysaccharide deacetylase family protein [Terriglobales bacterium]
MARLICTVAVLLCLLAGSAPAQEPSLAEKLGYPKDARLLIIQSDLAMMHSTDRAAFEALEKHWITSATIIVPCPWFPEAAAFARLHQGDYGLHLALNSEWEAYRWGPVSARAAVPSLLDKDGYFPPLTSDVVTHAKPEEVERELRAQIKKARAAGVPVTHLDAHMETLWASPMLMDIYKRVGREYGLPVLLPDGPVKDIQIGTGVPNDRWLDWYKKRLAALGPGVYQLTLHLGYDDEEARGATGDKPWGAAWRQRDWDMLRGEEFRQFLHEQKFILVTWRELSKAINE